MSDLSKFDVYKIIDNSINGYIFSVIEGEETEEPSFRYYIITVDNQSLPIIKRLNNTIEILNSDQFTLKKIEPESEEILKFASLLIESQLPRQPQDKSNQPNAYFSELGESDFKLLKIR